MTETDELLQTLTDTQVGSLSLKRARLHVVSGPDAGKEVEFEERIRIGARDLADFVVTDPKVSGLHCEIVLGDVIRVRDLDSKNGTFLGAHRIFDAVLATGETLAIGNTRLQITSLDQIEIPLPDENQLFGLIGRSAKMRALMKQIKTLGAADTTVLIEGETGTGKELVAEALHLAGRRSTNQLVIVDCGALPQNLIASELLGHERGAFTGADRQRIGAFEQASGGTLFLDEIGELPLELQPVLLRAIEKREIRRVGGAQTIATDVRIVAATHRDLAFEVSHGRFREDLFYRLAIAKLRVPPLRDRLEDIPLLAIHFLTQMGVPPGAILTAETIAELESYHWPGNVRELRNALERSIATSRPLQPDAMRESASTAVDLRESLKTVRQRAVDACERVYLTALLKECGGNVSLAARRAGVDRITVYRIMQRLGM